MGFSNDIIGLIRVLVLNSILFSVRRKKKPTPAPSFELPQNTYLSFGTKTATTTVIDVVVAKSEKEIDNRDPESLIKRMSSIQEVVSFKCDECDESYTTTKKLLMHIKSVHEATVEELSTDSLMTSTSLTVAPSPSSSPDYLDQILLDMKNSAKEQESHKIQTENKVHNPDTICEVTVDDLNGAGQSEQIKDGNNAEYFCDCGLKFSRLGWLVRHMQQCTNGFDCELCQKRFKTKKTLKKHKLLIHNKLFKCDQCEESYTTPKKLQRHIKSVHETTVKCEFCESILKNKNTYRHHVKKYHSPITKQKDNAGLTSEIENQANEEPNVTKGKDVLKENEKIAKDHKKSQPKLGPLYKCLQCPKTFSSTSGLWKQKAAHLKLDREKVTINNNPIQMSESDNNEVIEIVIWEQGQELSMGSAIVLHGDPIVGNQLVVIDNRGETVTVGKPVIADILTNDNEVEMMSVVGAKQSDDKQTLALNDEHDDQE